MTDPRQTGRLTAPRHAFRAVAALALAALVSGCGGGGVMGIGRDEARVPDLLNTQRSQRTPDEFAILPNKPIEIPQDVAALPPPTPGAGNRVDPTPREDAVAALGGDPGRVAVRSAGFPSADGALVGAASRYGVAEGIRSELAAADLAFRQANDGLFLERLFNVNIYYQTYRAQSLDQYAELQRFRRAGIRTVAAPPQFAE